MQVLRHIIWSSPGELSLTIETNPKSFDLTHIPVELLARCLPTAHAKKGMDDNEIASQIALIKHVYLNYILPEPLTHTAAEQCFLFIASLLTPEAYEIKEVRDILEQGPSETSFPEIFDKMNILVSQKYLMENIQQVLLQKITMRDSQVSPYSFDQLKTVSSDGRLSAQVLPNNNTIEIVDTKTNRKKMLKTSYDCIRKIMLNHDGTIIAISGYAIKDVGDEFDNLRQEDFVTIMDANTGALICDEIPVINSKNFAFVTPDYRELLQHMLDKKRAMATAMVRL
ncbi:MAG: hypothetical protein UU47_C0001G0042 [candidate division TM6 bacterium GW2011_GWE2_41_16]|nr:MAG: hypothetical protein UU47_C0001G0042 [candidate division TM6 bacterium GW2011_GWE2_41_16]